MITEENLQRMYEMFKKKTILKRPDFIECGFKNHDINPLIERRLIEKIKHGEYVLVNPKVSLDDEFNKCIALVINEEYDEAKKIFKACYKVDSKYIEELFKLILNGIENIASKNDTAIFKYIELALVIDDERYIRDIKFYLYLLNYLTNIPERYKGLVKTLQFDDIKLDENDDRYSAAYLQNGMRYSSLIGKRFIGKLAKAPTILEQISIRLVRWCSRKVRMEKIKIIDQIQEGNYEEVVAFLKRKKQLYGININEEMHLLLAQYIVNIKNDGVKPKTSSEIVDGLFEAIKVGNFTLALEIAKKYNEANERKKGYQNSILLLLQELLILINKVTFNDIVESLIVNHNVEDTLAKLSSYLKDINKNKYEPLFVALIKLSELEEDYTFTGPLMALAQISKGTFIFDAGYYRGCFYQAITENDIEIANGYLDVILGAKRIGFNIDTTSLMQDLKEIKGMISTEESQRLTDKIDTAVKQISESKIAKDYYGIGNIQDLTEAIEATNLDVESACRKLNIPEEQINFIRLIYAREYYRQGFYDVGDLFLKAIECSKGKSEKLRKEVAEVRKTRNFYIHQNNKETLKLSRILKPKKGK